MSSEDGGNTYQKQTQTGSSTRKRHYSSSSSSHHSSQSQSQSQQQQSSHYKENLERNSNDYLSSHDDIHSHHSHPPHQLGTNYNSNASPSRYYSSADTYILGNRLSTVSQEKYDENLTCCLPPPSPAPTSDRFILGMPSPSPSSHYQDRYTLHHRIMSPSSRYRTSIPDRYRDMPPKCPDRLVTPVHYLANSTPMASNDNFAYLTSTVHTPVKRYIPTPPTPEPPESDNMSTCSSVGGYHLPGPGTPHISIQQSANSSQQQQQVPKLLSQQPNNANAYAYRLKCCPNPNEQPGNSISPRATPPIVSSLDPQGDHYATPACIKHMKTPVNGSATLGRMPRQQICSVNMARAPSVEYIGNNGSRVLTPVSFVSEPANCLHCSTLRRTTGIHQTTQTTGPISPTTQPLSLPPQSTNHPQMSSNNEDLCDAKQMIRNTLPPSSSLSFQSIASQQTQKSQQSQQQQSQSQQTNQLAQLQQQVATQAQQLQAVQQSQQQQQAPLSPLTTQQNQPQMLQASPQQPNTPSPQDQAPIIQQQHGNQRSLVIQHQYRESPSSTMSSMTTLQRAGVQQRQPDRQRLFHKQQIKDYLKREMQRFFGVYTAGEEDELIKWTGRYNRFALRRFGRMKEDNEENVNRQQNRRQNPIDRPDILPEQSNDEQTNSTDDVNARTGTLFYRKASVPKMMWNGLSYVVRSLSTKRVKTPKQYSRSFAPAQIHSANDDSDLCEGLTPIQDDEVFFDILNTSNGRGNQQSQQYMSERVNGWRIKSTEASPSGRPGLRGTRISFRLLDGVLDNSRRPVAHEIKYHRHVILDDRYDHRPFFTYWINTVHVLIMILTLVCYGIGPIGFGVEQKTGQVLVTSLSLQQVTHAEYRNMWIGPRDLDLVHLGAKFAACMRKDHKILQVMAKTRRQERETACCIRNDDSGCVQSSQADCSVRGLWPTSISTWKKWSPGDSGPGGRISGSVCGLDPKYCDAPASIAPYEWPDDITKWPICRKTNSFSQRFRFKDHTAEHMVCEVIGHPCCISIYGDCRITTREYCDFVHGYFHEEASLCSQISCLNDVCGMFPFIITDIPDQFYRLFTSLLLHAGILHVAITVAFQHIFLADLERLIGPLRTAIIYLGSGIAGNLTSALLVPYKTEVGPLSSLAGVTSSLCVMLTFYYWKKLKKPHIALVKLLIVTIALFGLGTLPWQQNFASLIAGSIFGMILTLTIVPFMSITKFNRKSKINLIWTCLILHLTIYTTMLIIFYVFPNLFSSLEFTASEDLNADNNFNIFGGGGTGGATAIARSSNVISSSATSSSVSLSSAIANGGEKVMQAITNNNNHHINGNYNLNNIYNKINYNNYSHYINNNNNMISNNNTNPHNPMSAFFYRKDRY